MKFGAGAGPSSKVKELALIYTLQSQASSEAIHNSHCDDGREGGPQTQVATTFFEHEREVSMSNVLDGEVAELQADLRAFPAYQLEMDAMRAEERHIFAITTEGLAQGTVGIKKVMGICTNTANFLLPSNPTHQMCTSTHAE